LISRDDIDGVVNSSSDDNQALATCTRKGRRGSRERRGFLGRRDSLGEKHLHRREKRRILVISYVMSAMNLVTMLHSFHS
jgi:hypothetical protein